MRTLMQSQPIHPILEVKELTTRLQIGREVWTIVEKLSFSLYAGKTLALVGESGCGKSLTALSLLRILPVPPALPLTGEILYRGKSLLSLKEKEMRKIRGGKIAMIFQDPLSALNPVYTVGSQLIEATELHLNLYGSLAWQRARLALEEVGISNAEERLSAYPHQKETFDLSYLFITHDLSVIRFLADHIIVLNGGKVVESRDTEALFEDPQANYTKDLLKAIPLLRPKKIQ